MVTVGDNWTLLPENVIKGLEVYAVTGVFAAPQIEVPVVEVLL